jgi:hypothetical protein
MPLTPEQARALLVEDANKPRRTGGGGRTKADPTEVREIGVWFKLSHHISELGCSNPDCVDPRPKTDKGTKIVAEVKGKMICRYCFCDNYLSTNQ